MPIGSYSAIPVIATEMIRRRPASVLDLGLGFGMLGVAARQWIDLGVMPWKTFLVGVEVWADYRNPTWELHDSIYVRSIQEHVRLEEATYDMLLMGDVIEHFEEADAIELLDGLDRLVSPGGCLLVITPAVEMEQGPAHGNPYETHRSVWTSGKLKDRGSEILLDADDTQLPPAVPALVARRTVP